MNPALSDGRTGENIERGRAGVKIAVIGAGAIGGLVAGYLKLKGEEVFLVGRPDSVAVIEKEGLRICGARGDFTVNIEAGPRLKQTFDLIILATKTQDIESSLEANKDFLKGAVILTTQNGVRADELAAKFIPKEKIISSIVMFGATYLEPGKIMHNFEGAWVMGNAFSRNDKLILEVSRILSKAFPTVISEEIKGMKYLKIFVNANNCIPAILGISMQEAFADLEVSKISIGIWKEGLEVLKKAGVNPVSLPDFPLERVTKLAGLPVNEAAKIFCGIMLNLSKEPLFGSILQSIKRGKPSEIDYINGEFVKLSQEHDSAAPLNSKLVEMVHNVEKNNKFFTREELLEGIKGLVN